MSTQTSALNEAQLHKKMAVEFFNETWKLLDKPDRTSEEDTRMIHLAHASCLHWQLVGTAENFAIGEWQVSRVHAVLRQPDAALYHAKRSLDIAGRNNLGPFNIACGHEAVARALAITDAQSALASIATARKIAAEITDPEDRKILDDDLSSIRV
jgi:hypothetical protein